jgi:hypothetical protein
MQNRCRTTALVALPALAVVLAYAPPAHAEVRALTNGSFETTVPMSLLPASTWAPIAADNVPGWSTDETDCGGSGCIEFWRSGFLSTPAADGDYLVELNSNQQTAYYQDICIESGEVFDWSIQHRGRAGLDTIMIRIGPPGAENNITSITTDNDACSATSPTPSTRPAAARSATWPTTS